MSICLINPPQLQLREPTAYIPLGLAYIAAKHPDCAVVNWAGGIVEDELPVTDVYGITCQSATFNSTKEVVSLIRQLRPHATVIVGGALPSVNPDKARDTGCDSIFRGLYTDIRDYLPDRSKFKREHVINLTGLHGSFKPSTFLISSMSCPYLCKFCEKGHEMYRKVVYRESEHVVKELNQLKSEYGIEHVRFTDDCFTLNKKRTIALCNAIAKLGITYICITRTDRVDHDILRALAQSGCLQIFYGIESGSQKILDAMCKGVTVQQNIEAIKMTQHYGIKVKALLLFKYPGETDEDRQLTLDFMKVAQPDLYVLSKWSDSDFFYPDNDTEWLDFKKRISECINIPTVSN